MDHTRSLGGGSGRYHSRAAMPRPAPPRPPAVSASAPLGVGGATPMVRRSVFAPPFPHGDLRVVNVAIVVVENILAPVRWAGRPVLLGFLTREVTVIPVDIPIAAVRVGGVIDHDDHVLADVLEEWRLVDGKPVSEF